MVGNRSSWLVMCNKDKVQWCIWTVRICASLLSDRCSRGSKHVSRVSDSVSQLKRTDLAMVSYNDNNNRIEFESCNLRFFYNLLTAPHTAMRLLRLSSLLLPLLWKPQQLTATCCLCCPRNVFIRGLLVSLVRIKHTVYNNVIRQLLI